MKRLSLIAARSKNGFIGKEGKLPWHFPEDLRFFKTKTMGHAILMGRKTYESVGKPLPNRTNIVVTRQPGYEAPGCIVVHTLEEAISAVAESDDEPFVIGGGELYRAALPIATHVYLTELDVEVDGDARFPSMEGLGYVETERCPGKTAGVTFVTYERTPAAR